MKESADIWSCADAGSIIRFYDQTIFELLESSQARRSEMRDGAFSDIKIPTEKLTPRILIHELRREADYSD